MVNTAERARIRAMSTRSTNRQGWVLNSAVGGPGKGSSGGDGPAGAGGGDEAAGDDEGEAAEVGKMNLMKRQPKLCKAWHFQIGCVRWFAAFSP